MRRLIAPALAGVVLLPSAAVAKRQVSPGCKTKACAKRVCKTSACRGRVAARRVAYIASADRAWLYKVRMCESGGSGLYRANTGNGFYGAYQFTLSSWRAVGGSGYPHLASPAEQDRRALRLRAVQGTGAWPRCG